MEVEQLSAIFTAHTAQAERNFASLDRKVTELDRRLSNFKGVEQFEARLRRSSTSANILAGAAGGLAVTLGHKLVSSLTDSAGALLNFNSKLETTRIAFQTMLGSSQLATEHLQELQAFALTTPFQFTELIDASTRMQALGFEAKDVVPLLTDVGNAVSAVGGGKERLDRVTLALAQMQARGRVAANEINQLSEAGIPGWELLATTIGKTRAETMKLAEEGKISAAVFLESFRKFSQQNFGDMMQKQSRTFAGAMSNIEDTLLQTASTAFEPLYRKISEITVRIAEGISKGKPTLERTMRTLLEGLGEVVAEVGVSLGEQFARSFANSMGNINWESFLPQNLLKRMQPITYGVIQGAVNAAVDRSGPTMTGNTQKQLLNQMNLLNPTKKDWRPKSMGGAPNFSPFKPMGGTGTGGGGGGGGGGADPARESRRLAEIALQSALDSLEAQENALNRSLSTRRVSLEQFTTDAIALARKERQAVLDGLDEEAREASKLRSGRASALAEIARRRADEERKSAERVTGYIDALDEDFAQRDRIREESMLRVKQTMANTEKNIWQRLADQRVITQEEAIRAIGSIEREEMERQMELAASDLARAGQDKTKQMEARMRMGEIEAQIGAHSIELEHKAADALRERLALQRDFNAALEQTLGDVRLQTLELQKQSVLHQLDITGAGSGRGRTARRAIDSIELQEQDERTQLAKRQLFLNLLKEMEQKSFEERAQLYAAFIAQRDALDAQHDQTVRQINDRPLIEMRQRAEELASDLTSNLENAIREGWENGMTAGAISFAQGILDMINSAALQSLEDALADVFTQAGKAGSKKGGVIGTLLDWLGLGGGDSDALANTATNANTTATTTNTIAINSLTSMMAASSVLGGESEGGGILGTLLGAVIGGAAGGLGGGASIGGGGSAAGGVLSGEFATGGRPTPGLPALVGDDPQGRPNPEIFIPDTAGTIVPLKNLGGGGNLTVNLTQVIHAPNGRVAPESAEQAAMKSVAAIGRFHEQRGGNF